MATFLGLFCFRIDFAKDGRSVLAKLGRKRRTHIRLCDITFAVKELGTEIVDGSLTLVPIRTRLLLLLLLVALGCITQDKLDFAQGTRVARRTLTVVALLLLLDCLVKSVQLLLVSSKRCLIKTAFACSTVEAGHITLGL